MEFNYQSWKPFLSIPSFLVFTKNKTQTLDYSVSSLGFWATASEHFLSVLRMHLRTIKIIRGHHYTKCFHTFIASLDPHQLYRVLYFCFYRSQWRKHLAYLVFELYLVPEIEFKKAGKKRGRTGSNNSKRVHSSESLKGLEPEMNRDKVCFLPHVNLFLSQYYLYSSPKDRKNKKILYSQHGHVVRG